MSAVNPIFALLPLAAALGACFALQRIFGEPSEQGRFATIDGLRGYLAFFVFVHHGAVWFYYLHGQPWEDPPSHIFTNFGQIAVAFFFMITGFLFYSKILHARDKRLDWTRLYVSRVLRLVPLYFLSMALMFVICGILSDWTLHQPLSAVAAEIGRWLSFSVLGDPGINGVKNTSTIVADVVWTLPYEWFFYLMLPLLALTAGVRAPLRFLIPSVLIACILFVHKSSIFHWLSFCGGIAAAIAVRHQLLDWITEKLWLSAVGLALIFGVLVGFPTTHAYLPILLLSIAFIVIAGGNSLFGILSSAVSRTLGEMTYSIYLLHGIILFTFIRFVIGTRAMSQLNPLTYWLCLSLISPLIILVCKLTFEFIEKPAMLSTKRATELIRGTGRTRQVNQ